MTRPAGLVLIAAGLFILGVRLMSGPTDHDSALTLRIVQMIVGVVSLVAGHALWTRRPYALKAYWTWTAAWLLGGATVVYAVDGSPLWEVAIWLVFTGAVWVAVGMYVRSALRRAAS